MKFMKNIFFLLFLFLLGQVFADTLPETSDKIIPEQVLIDFMKSNYDMKYQNPQGDTVLHLATLFGYERFIYSLDIEESDVLTKNKKGHTPLKIAKDKGNTNLLSYFDEIFERAQFQKVYELAKSGATAEDLLAKKLNVNARSKEGRTALHVLSGVGHLEGVRMLIQAGADVNGKTQYGGLSPLYWALGGGKAEIVKLLLSSGANKDVTIDKEETYLHKAAMFGDSEVVKVLLEAGLDKNKPEKGLQTPLHKAARYGKLKDLTLLIDDKNLNAQDKSGQTPLMLSSAFENVESTKQLLLAGADPNIKDKDGETPLHAAALGLFSRDTIAIMRGADSLEYLAAVKKNKKIIELLLKYGARKNEVTIYGDTPLHWAVSSGTLEAVTLLIDEEILNLKNDRGVSPLFKAVGAEIINDHERDIRIKIIRKLLKEGVDLSIENHGETILNYARKTSERREDETSQKIANLIEKKVKSMCVESVKN